MMRRRIRTPLMGLAVGLLVSTLAAPVTAQKGGKPTSKPATGSFRCPGVECPTADPPAILTDAIRGDQVAVPFSAADGATLDTVNEFSLRLVPNGRFLLLDFSNGSAPCGAACRRTFPSIEIDSDNLALFHTNVIDPATGGEASNGLLSIPVGATWRSRLKVAFDTVSPTGQRIQWAVRFNPRDYYPSDHISVTRTTASMWDVFATATERAMLVSVSGRQKGYTNEGLYQMPFKVTASTP